MSGFTLDVKADIREVEKMLFAAQKKVLPKATARALNVTANAVQSQAVEMIAKDLGLNQRQTRKYLLMKKATWGNLMSSVTAVGNRIPVHMRQARQTKKGVTYKGKGGKRTLIPHAFIQEIRVKGVPGAYKRRGKERFPVTFLRTFSPPRAFIQDYIVRAMKKLAAERWGKEFPRQVKYYLQRAGYQVK